LGKVLILGVKDSIMLDFMDLIYTMVLSNISTYG